EIIENHTPEIIQKMSDLNDLHHDSTNLPFENENVFEALKKIAVDRKNVAKEFIYTKKDGTNLPVIANATPIISRTEFEGLLIVAADIRGIKKAEEELKLVLNLTKRQNERLKNFAYIVSHNLRSHSGNLSTLLKLLIKDVPAIESNKILNLISKSSDNLEET